MQKIAILLILLTSFISIYGHKNCSINETQAVNCNACEASCDQPWVTCTIMGCRLSWRTCQCKNGYLRYNNTCILKDDCPEYLKCGPHAFWNYRSSEENQISCDDITSGRKLPKNDFTPGSGTCICESGFVRLTKNGICIKQEKCANRNKNST